MVSNPDVEITVTRGHDGGRDFFSQQFVPRILPYDNASSRCLKSPLESNRFRTYPPHVIQDLRWLVCSIQTGSWLAAVWAGLLVVVLIYYLRHCWKIKEVALFGRSGPVKFSRTAHPIKYWMIMLFYAILVIILFSCLLIHVVKA
jgi:hypothetical protein